MESKLTELKEEVLHWRQTKKHKREPVPEAILNLIRNTLKYHPEHKVIIEAKIDRGIIKRALKNSFKMKDKNLPTEIHMETPLVFSEVKSDIQELSSNGGPISSIVLTNADGQTLKINNYTGIDKLVSIFLTGSQGGGLCSR